MNPLDLKITCQGFTTVELDELNDLQGNLKDLSEENYVRLRNSMVEFGFSFPVFMWVDETGKKWIVDAHQRKRVLLKMREEGIVIPPLPADIIHAKDKIEAKKKLLLHESHYGKLTQEGYDEFFVESGFEFKEDEISDFLDLPDIFKEPEESSVVEDEAPEVSQEPAISKLGEVYQLGRHRLMCGDATKIEDVEKLMDGQKADMVFTDPPYGVAVVGENGKIGAGNLAKNKTYSPIIGDETTQTAKDAYNLFVSLGIDKMIIWGGNYFTDFLPPSACWIIWDKRDGMTSNNFADCEIAWTSFTGPARIYKQLWNGMIRAGGEGEKVYPTQKPVGLHVNILRDYSSENNLILDLFGGSGSTLIACEQTNRTCYMMELDPKYCDVIRKRYAKFIGKEAEWEATTPCIA